MNESDSGPFENDVGQRAAPGSELSAWQRGQFARLAIDVANGSGTLTEAIRLALHETTEIMDWSAAHARWEFAGESGIDWHVRQGSEEDLAALGKALGRGPVAEWNDGGKGSALVLMEALMVLPETRAREAASAAGLRGYASLPVLAAGKPVALLELFATVAPPRSGGPVRRSEVCDALEVLAAQLGLVATRERMKGAVRTAAAHARRQMTELEEARSRLDRGGGGSDAALYDERTGLPRSEVLRDRIRQAIRRRQRSPRDMFAVMVAELEGLERVREESEQAAEDLWVAAGRRLAGSTRPADSVALDGERFVMIVEGIRAFDEALAVADRVEKELRRPFPMTHDDVRLDTRIGIVFAGPAYDEPDSLLADAAAAARRARGARERVQVFDRAAEENHVQRQKLQAELSGAVERQEFFLEYQPIVALPDGRITGLETFVRWRHPELGLVPPDQFIPVAATSPLIHDIGFWIIEHTCEQISLWRDRLAPIALPPVGINVTGRQLFNEIFLPNVRDILERTGIKGRQIRFDVSEGDLMQDAGKAASVLDRLQGMGIQVAIDDFGTGYSSLSLLHELPVGALKIDRSFVSHRRERLRKWGVARTIVELARILEVEVIAEGIETREQFLTLKKAGCAQAQGFFFSGPVGPEKAEALVRDGYPLDLEAPRR